MAKRGDELLPVPYFHVVFTLPEAINPLCMHSPKAVYDILFEASWATLKSFGENKDMQMGMIGLLHTWGQNLSLHPHLHCIVPGGGLNQAGAWRNSRLDGKFLFSVKAMSKVFRAKFCEKLKQKLPVEYQKIRADLWKQAWVVFAKRPFGSSKSVVEYLGRYSHKIAISNHRISGIDAQKVTFSYKDYRTGGQNKTMALNPEELIRRFALHILPKGFVKIRHYGFLSSTWKRNKLKILQVSLGVKVVDKAEKVPFVRKCSCCKVGILHAIAVFDNRGPPVWYIGASQNSFSCPTR